MVPEPMRKCEPCAPGCTKPLSVGAGYEAGRLQVVVGFQCSVGRCQRATASSETARRRLCAPRSVCLEPATSASRCQVQCETSVGCWVRCLSSNKTTANWGVLGKKGQVKAAQVAASKEVPRPGQVQA